MAILAECDICGNQHRVNDARSGSSIHCKDCGVQITVPPGNIITPEAFFEENGLLRHRQQQESGFWPWLVAIFACCVVTLALIGIVWFCVTLQGGVRGRPRVEIPAICR
jgi:hypothetical protein